MNYLSEYAWMQTLGWTLLHSFWQIGLIALSWAILRPLLKNSSSEKRYLALIGAILTAFICAAMTFWQLLPKQAELSIIRVSTIELSELPSSQQAPVILSEVESDRSWTQFFNHIAPYLSVLWIIGAAIMGIRFSGGIYYIQKLRHRGLQAVDESWQIKAQNLANKVGIKQKWQLKESERVSQPLTIGHFKPLILVPLGMLSSLSPEQVEAIILHELAHIKRSDFLFNLIQSLIEILFFYHPAIWWLSKEIRQEREMCCDDLAVEAMGDAFTYAETLTLLQSYRHSPQQFLTMKAKGNTHSFSKRIKRLFQENHQPSPWRSISATILLVVILSGSGFYAFTQTQSNNPDENSETEPQEIIAEYFIEPEMPQEEFDKISGEIFTYDPQKILLANRAKNGLIEELVVFGLYVPSPRNGQPQRYYKTGLRNFTKIQISVIKVQNGKPMVSLKDPVGDAIWTDKLDQQTVSLKVGDKAEKLIEWVKLQQQKGAEIAIEEINVDPENGNLLSYKLNNRGPFGDQAINLPAAETILYSGEGNPFTMMSHALPRVVEGKKKRDLKEFPSQALNQIGSHQVWVFLDNKSVGSFESSDGLQQRLIEQGIISSSESIGKASYYSIQNGDFTEMLDAEQLESPSQGLDSLPEIFNVYVLSTWEHLAEKFSQEGPKKHRLYFFGENRIGFRKGLIEEVVREISSEQQVLEESVSVTILRGSEAEKKYKIKGIEVVEIINQ